MVTKEIEIYIKEQDFINSNSCENHLVDINYWTKKELNPNIKYYKAKIIIEVPEKKIEVTASKIEEILKNNCVRYCDSARCTNADKIKADLGF